MRIQLSDSLMVSVLTTLAHEDSPQADEVISDLAKQGVRIPPWILMRTGKAVTMAAELKLAAVAVGDIRDLNNSPRFNHGRRLRMALVCETCWHSFTADLARYWCPRDAETFLCPDCDTPLQLRYETGEPLHLDRLAQRLIATLERNPS